MGSRKGTADEELAKKDAERAKKQEPEEEDHGRVTEDLGSKRRGSISSDSVSSISTRSAASPPPRAHAKAPQRRAPPSRRSLSSGSRSRSSLSGSSSTGSRSPDSVADGRRQEPRGRSDDFRNDRNRPSPRPRGVRYRSPPRRNESLERDRRTRPSKPRVESSDFFDDERPGRHPGRNTRPPEPAEAPRIKGGRGEGSPRRYRDRGEGHGGRKDRDSRSPPPRGPPRQRSLSPFSKRLALTQAMKSDR